MGTVNGTCITGRATDNFMCPAGAYVSKLAVAMGCELDTLDVTCSDGTRMYAFNPTSTTAIPADASGFYTTFTAHSAVYDYYCKPSFLYHKINSVGTNGCGQYVPTVVHSASCPTGTVTTGFSQFWTLFGGTSARITGVSVRCTPFSAITMPSPSPTPSFRPCPVGWGGPFDNACYKLVTSTTTFKWTSAQAACENNFSGSKLASFETRAQGDAVALGTCGGTSDKTVGYWVGLNDVDSESVASGFPSIEFWEAQLPAPCGSSASVSAQHPLIIQGELLESGWRAIADALLPARAATDPIIHLWLVPPAVFNSCQAGPLKIAKPDKDTKPNKLKELTAAVEDAEVLAPYIVQYASAEP